MDDASPLERLTMIELDKVATFQRTSLSNGSLVTYYMTPEDQIDAMISYIYDMVCKQEVTISIRIVHSIDMTTILEDSNLTDTLVKNIVEIAYNYMLESGRELSFSKLIVSDGMLDRVLAILYYDNKIPADDMAHYTSPTLARSEVLSVLLNVSKYMGELNYGDMIFNGWSTGTNLLCTGYETINADDVESSNE